MRAVNLVVEVFIDVADDGTAYAEALMLRDADKHLLGQGFARLDREHSGADRVDDRQVAARALVDLAESLTCHAGAAGRASRPVPMPAG